MEKNVSLLGYYVTYGVCAPGSIQTLAVRKKRSTRSVNEAKSATGSEV